MRENTPPRVPDIENDEIEEIVFENEVLPEDDDTYLEGPIDSEDDDDNISIPDSGAADTPPPDHALLTFKEHERPVFGCALNAERGWAVTGDENDKIFIWDINTTNVVHTLNEHKDTVTEIHFTFDGRYMVSGDLAGELYAFKIPENGNDEILKVWEYSMGDMTWMRVHKSANVLIAGSDTGEIYVWRIPSGECKILAGNSTRCETGEITSDGKKLFAAYTNGAVKLWDIKACKVLMVADTSNLLSPCRSIPSVACHPDSSLYMAGCENGKIFFYNNYGLVNVVEASGAVECVGFSNCSEHKLAASGTLNGDIMIWDYGKYTLRVVCSANSGVTKLKWFNDFTLFVGTVIGNIQVFDARTGECIHTFLGHWFEIYEFMWTPTKDKLLSVSEDATAKIFEIPNFND